MELATLLPFSWRIPCNELMGDNVMDDYCICSLQEKYIHNSVNCMVTEVQENSFFEHETIR